MVNLSDIKVIMAIVMFALGFISFFTGIWTALSKDYQDALNKISTQVSKINAQSLADVAAAPIIDSTSRLLEAISGLIRTRVGVGAFLSICGVIVCLTSFWMISTL
jgi:hypothetical protein